MGTVAEGVEDRAILPLLAELGFRHVQGFALGRPVKARDAAALLT
jgi:EAL domain-containing protein (putative c-di-GMP-specific phosphodiesterase class I)